MRRLARRNRVYEGGKSSAYKMPPQPFQNTPHLSASAFARSDDTSWPPHASGPCRIITAFHAACPALPPPHGTMMLANELIRANKDFDLLLFPNRRHGFGGEPYMTRRRWDYFVRHLMGAEPPKEYTFPQPAGASGAPRPGGTP